MDKCDGCPLDAGQPGFTGCIEVEFKDCHLTPSDMEIIRAMITGRFNCEHCWHGTIEGKGETVYCVMAGNSVPVTCFCDRWQERKEGEDG